MEISKLIDFKHEGLVTIEKHVIEPNLSTLES